MNLFQYLCLSSVSWRTTRTKNCGVEILDSRVFPGTRGSWKGFLLGRKYTVYEGRAFFWSIGFRHAIERNTEKPSPLRDQTRLTQQSRSSSDIEGTARRCAQGNALKRPLDSAI